MPFPPTWRWLAFVMIAALGGSLAAPRRSWSQPQPAGKSEAAKPEAAKPAAAPAAADAPAPAAVVIADEPRAIDPGTLLDAKLRTLATVRFEETSLSEVAAWVQQQTGLNVILDARSLDTLGIAPSEPITDHLVNAPVYLLLDRLRQQRIGWRVAKGVLYLQAIGDRATIYTQQYNVGDLLDQHYKPQQLQDTIVATVQPGSWASAGGSAGDVAMLGDVLFIRQDARAHRAVAGLLAALRQPARRTLIDDPPANQPIRAALTRPATLEGRNKPLSAVVESLATTTAIDIRLDRPTLRMSRVSERLPVTLEVRDQSLPTVLEILLTQLKLTWVVRDGVLWITTPDQAEETRQTAVFDVRDLCPDDTTSDLLRSAILSQAAPDSWSESGGNGVVEFARPGIMVVYQTPERLDVVLTLLENYRIALRNSKRRLSPEDDPEAVVTSYYRMPTAVAEDLEKLLPTLIEVDTWRSPDQPNAVGTIRRIRSWDERLRGTADDQQGGTGTPAVTVSYSILLIEQKRRVQRKIPEILQKIEHGDQVFPAGGGMGGMGGGMGGGGGFF